MATHRHTAAQWRELHQLSNDAISACLKQQRLHAMLPVIRCKYRWPLQGPSLSEAKKIWAKAASNCLVELNGPIEAVCNLSEIRPLAESDFSEPHIIDHGSDKAPTVYLDYHNDSQGLMVLAHELGHALQLVATRRSCSDAFMPPIARECCAFLSELALIAYSSQLSGHCLGYWQTSDRVVWETCADKLAVVLQDDQTSYDYDLNYIPARVAAINLFVGPDPLWSLFTSPSFSIAKISENLCGLDAKKPVYPQTKRYPTFEEGICGARMHSGTASIGGVCPPIINHVERS